MFLSRALHIPVIFFPGSAECASNEIRPVIELLFDFCIPQHSLLQGQHVYLPQVRPQAPLPAFGWVAVAGAAAPAAASAGAAGAGATEDQCDEV